MAMEQNQKTKGLEFVLKHPLKSKVTRPLQYRKWCKICTLVYFRITNSFNVPHLVWRVLDSVFHIKSAIILVWAVLSPEFGIVIDLLPRTFRQMTSSGIYSVFFLRPTISTPCNFLYSLIDFDKTLQSLHTLPKSPLNLIRIHVSKS